MAYPSVTNTFVDATTCNAVDANKNFKDLVDGVSDGTKDINVSNPTILGSACVTGDVYTTQLTDYSSTSTIAGFSAFQTKEIFYKQIGSTYILWFNIVGTPTGGTPTFTVPGLSNFQTNFNISESEIFRTPIFVGTSDYSTYGYLRFIGNDKIEIEHGLTWATSACASGFFCIEG